jgi:hypothetical protein
LRLIPADPDVQTLVARIDAGDIDLQPNFQRGEVWGKQKKQRLIDSILRDWHIPPVHVIENPITKRQEVLDGQQRLTAIRDFIRGDFPIDGHTEPPDIEIRDLDGKRYVDLDSHWRRRINQFSIRVFRLVEFKASEPAELFFRLNQPTSLTSAEQRNAFFGPVRAQIKSIVEGFTASGIRSQEIGFSNSRMAYDDVFSRAAFALERRDLGEKITAANLAALYRSENPLREETIILLEDATKAFVNARQRLRTEIHFNKATLFSWLIFIARFLLTQPDGFSGPILSDYMYTFDSRRQTYRQGESQVDDVHRWMLYVYDDRSSARVADTSSVVLRDAILWGFFFNYCEHRISLRLSRAPNFDVLQRYLLDLRYHKLSDESFAKKLIDAGWARL